MKREAGKHVRKYCTMEKRDEKIGRLSYPRWRLFVIGGNVRLLLPLLASGSSALFASGCD